MFGAVVLAGGSGTRFGGDTPKQFLSLEGRLIWRRSCDLFLHHGRIAHTVLVLPAGRTEGVSVSGLLTAAGGKTRTRSAENGVRALPEDVTHVAVHDAARPLADAALLDALIDAAAEHGAAVPVCPVASTVRYVREGRLSKAVERDGLHEMQTPQVARRDWLLEAMAGDAEDTDEAGLLMAAGRSVAAVPAPRRNFKVTTPEDLRTAAALLRGGEA